MKWDPVKGRSLFSAEDVPKGHFMSLSDAANSWFIDIGEWKDLNEFANKYPSATMYRELINFVLAYGYESINLSLQGWIVSLSSTNTFINHSCKTGAEETIGAAGIFTNDVGNYLGFAPPLSRRAEMTGKYDVNANNCLNHLSFR